jgi:hypothetical protein
VYSAATGDTWRPLVYSAATGDTWRPPVYSAATENEQKLNQQSLMPVKPFATAWGPLKWCDIPRSDVSLRAFIQMADIYFEHLS